MCAFSIIHAVQQTFPESCMNCTVTSGRKNLFPNTSLWTLFSRTRSKMSVLTCIVNYSFLHCVLYKYKVNTPVCCYTCGWFDSWAITVHTIPLSYQPFIAPYHVRTIHSIPKCLQPYPPRSNACQQ